MLSRNFHDARTDDYLFLSTGEENAVIRDHVAVTCRYDSVEIDRKQARELAAILTHFADTGELPGGGGRWA